MANRHLELGVFAPTNRVTVLAIGTSAVAVSMAVFLVVEMNSAFDGLIRLDVARGLYPKQQTRVNFYFGAIF